MTNQKALARPVDQSEMSAACQRDSSLATFLRHCKARFMVVVFLVLLRQGLLSTLYLSYAFAF